MTMVERVVLTIERADANDDDCDGIAARCGITNPEVSDWAVHLARAALSAMMEPSKRSMTMQIDPAEVARVADGLGSCERDLLTGNVTSWGAWITATYPGLIAKGLMERTFAGDSIRIEPTPLGAAVAAHLKGSRHDPAEG